MHGLFEHCADEAEAWATFYSLACLVHPDQGGAPGEMAALCRAAREVLDWEPLCAETVPPLFDIFCRATGTRNPFGDSIGTQPAAGGGAAPGAYDPAAEPWSAAAPPPLGRMERVFTAGR